MQVMQNWNVVDVAATAVLQKVHFKKSKDACHFNMIYVQKI